MFDRKRTQFPSRLNIAGQQQILITIEFVAESSVGLDQYIADLTRRIEDKASTRSIQLTHNVGVKDVTFEVIRGVGPYRSR